MSQFPMPETPEELTKDAYDRRYVPGSVVVSMDLGEVQITSLPWFEGKGECMVARTMARLTVGDPTTNVEIRYFAIMRFLREESL